MRPVRIDCGDEGNRDTFLRILRSGLIEVPGARRALVGKREIAFPANDAETGRACQVEARPHGERFVEIEIVQESRGSTFGQ